MIVKINISIWVLVALLSLLIKKNTVERQSSLKMAIQKQYINRWLFSIDHESPCFSPFYYLYLPHSQQEHFQCRDSSSLMLQPTLWWRLPLSSTRHRLCSPSAAPSTWPCACSRVSRSLICRVFEYTLSSLTCSCRPVLPTPVCPCAGSASFISVINA